MTQAPTSKQLFTRRAVVFGSINLAAMGVLLGRLYYLQFLRADEYRTLAEGNRVKLQPIVPVRGLLLDRNGTPLANNQKNFRLYLDTETTKDPGRVLTALAKVLELTPARIEQLVAGAKANRYAPVLVKEHLSWDELSQFEFYKLSYPEVFVDTGQVRFYPYGERASHLVGYVGTVAEGDTDSAELARMPDFKIGKSGIEKMLESDLRGTAGVRQTEVNVHGLAVRELGRKEGKPGRDITLTVDARLQEYAAARLEGQSAAAIVMDVKTGDVRALVSVPSFDPNSFSKGISAKYWGELQANSKIPLMNKAIAGQYAPGSTFKLAMGLAALEHQAVSRSARVYCNGFFQFGNHQFSCWKQPGGHGSVSLHEAIEQSCDVYFYTMAQRLGIDPIAGMARKLGLGKGSGLGLPGEKGGIVPDDEWKEHSYGQRWQGGDTINVGIGQGYILATPLQVAVMTARIASGFAVTPRLIAGDPRSFMPLDIAEDSLAAVQSGMNAVVNTPGGTAYGSRILDPRFAMAGKTGTSQVRKLVAHGIDQNTLPWEERHHAWFTGYAPVNAPRYAATVLVEHGGGGASAAAPVVRDILLKILSLDAGEPGLPLPEKPRAGKEEETD